MQKQEQRPRPAAMTRAMEQRRAVLGRRRTRRSRQWWGLCAITGFCWGMSPLALGGGWAWTIAGGMAIAAATAWACTDADEQPIRRSAATTIALYAAGAMVGAWASGPAIGAVYATCGAIGLCLIVCIRSSKADQVDTRRYTVWDEWV